MATTPAAYTATPKLAQWQKDSSVTLARRSDDTVLTRIDELIGAYETCASDYARLQLKSDLFFTLDYWLKVYTSKSGMSKGRQPAIYELYKFTAHSLAQMLSCTINTLPEYLERHFGRKLTYHGEHLDVVGQLATYLTRAEVDKYRIVFRDKKAYMWTWPGKGTELTVVDKRKRALASGEKRQPKSMKLVLANSESASNPRVFGLAKWGGFAMSMSRDLYMARHHCGEGQANVGNGGNFYHSSYLAGDPVLCAGTILIENGLIRAICNDSGHYQPDEANFISFLQAMMMHGIDVQTVTIYDYSRKHAVSGADFIQNRGNWAKMLLREQQTAYEPNALASQKYATEKTEHKRQVANLWKQAVTGGIVSNTLEGRLFFAEKLLRNYTTPNQKNKQPFQLDVNTTWILGVIEKAYGPVPGAPPPKNPLPPGLLGKGLPPGQQHGALPPRRP